MSGGRLRATLHLVSALRSRVRLLAAFWLVAQSCLLAGPVCSSGVANLVAADSVKCSTSAAAGRICPMRRPDGMTCPMHRGAAGQTACTMTAACRTTGDFLTPGLSSLAVPLDTSSFPVAFTLTRVALAADTMLQTRSTSPDPPPPRA